jgi:hypothetical protein
MSIIHNEKNELIPQWSITSWRMCIDYRKLNEDTQKDHFPLPFIDEMLERLTNHSFYYLDGYSGYHQIPIQPNDQSKNTFTCSYGTFAYMRMSFGLCNAPASFQRCMMAIFCGLIEKVGTSRWLKQKGKFRLPNLRNGEKRLTTVPSYIKKEPKDDTTSESRSSNSSWEKRYFSLTLAYIYSVMVSFVVSGKALT